MVVKSPSIGPQPGVPQLVMPGYGFPEGCYDVSHADLSQNQDNLSHSSLCHPLPQTSEGRQSCLGKEHAVWPEREAVASRQWDQLWKSTDPQLSD